MEELQNQSASIPWDDFLVFLRNSHPDLSADKVVKLCTSCEGSACFRPLLSAAGLWFHPARYFETLADPEVGTMQQLYRCVSNRFTQVRDGEVVSDEVIRPGFVMPPDVCWEAPSIAFGALTTCFGLAPSIVTSEPIERGVAFRIGLPRHRPVHFALSSLTSWFHRDTAEDVRNVLLCGHERSLRLEREIDERKVAETALRASEERFRRITEAVPGVIYQYQQWPDGRSCIPYASEGIRDIYEVTLGEVRIPAVAVFGRLTIETSSLQIREEDLVNYPERKAGRFLQLAVSDSGCGITEEVQGRRFESSFTTKGAEAGTGLRLAVVHGIVSQAGGHASVSSTVGVGTTCKRLFPSVIAAISPQFEETPVSICGTETILLVADEELVQRVASISIEHHGDYVLSAIDAADAIRIAEEYSGSIHLLVTDVVMPDMGVRE